jgi:uncharacterized protein YjiS (DUF1127 family)
MAQALLQMTNIHLWPRVAGLFAAARRRSRDRAALATLSDRELSDMRMSRAMRAYELNKPFWRD